MKPKFADTFYYLALLSPGDVMHDRAVEFTREFDGTLVTTEWILTELADGLSSIRTRAALIHFVRNLRADAAVRIVPARRGLLAPGWSLYSRRLDKDWSLTDCISFAVMQQLKITEALTGDHHFEQAGFRAILK